MNLHSDLSCDLACDQDDQSLIWPAACKVVQCKRHPPLCCRTFYNWTPHQQKQSSPRKRKRRTCKKDNCKFLFIPFYCVNHIQQLKIKDSSIEFLMKLRVLCKSDTSVQELITRNIHVHFLVNHKVLSGNISRQWKLSRVATI